ncbi:MAG: methyltransferase domain-containing protein [Dongiaceae bacterium]
MPSWDPQQYVRFADHRLRPGLDLLARVPDLPPDPPGDGIWDLGCGSGALAPFLARRWPDRRVRGLDSSAEMLEAARRAVPEVDFEAGDIAGWQAPAPAALLYANAALQWLPDHRTLFPRLLAMLAPGGVLAVQMPHNHDSPSHQAMRAAAADGPWSARLGAVRAIQPVAEAAAYHRILAGAAALDIWETEYLHVLTGPDPVVEWTKGTGLRPYLDRLEGAERQGFLAAYAARVAAAYPPEPDGRTLFPFRRLFIVAQR